MASARRFTPEKLPSRTYRLTPSDPGHRLARMNRQRLGLWGTFAFSALAVIGVLVQVYLIGGFFFGETGWLDTHRNWARSSTSSMFLRSSPRSSARGPTGARPDGRSRSPRSAPFRRFSRAGAASRTAERRTACVPCSTRPDRLRHRIHDRVAHLEDAPGPVRDQRDSDDLTRLRRWRAAELRPCAAGGDASRPRWRGRPRARSRARSAVRGTCGSRTSSLRSTRGARHRRPRDNPPRRRRR